MTKLGFRKLSVRILMFCSLLGLSIWMLTTYQSAKYLTQSNPVHFEDLLMIDGHKVEVLNIQTEDEIQISSWFVRNKNPKTIILLSGIKGNRLHQIQRAKFYLNLGYSVLMPDLRGTGKSQGDLVSFGWHERKDLKACIDHLHAQGIHQIGADGQSLGAATIVYSFHEEQPAFDFIILESCYDNISNAFQNRVKGLGIPLFLLDPVKYFTERRIEADESNLSPETIVKRINCPTLILAGDRESQIPIHETQKIFENCGSPNKHLHFFKGGKHEDLYARFPQEYESVVHDFIESLEK